MKVRVHWNLHKNKYSVIAWEGDNKGKVISYEDLVTLVDCTFPVLASGNRRARKEGSKNVHAYVQGTWVFTPVKFSGVEITYNPFTMVSFQRLDGSQIKTAKKAILVGLGKPKVLVEES